MLELKKVSKRVQNQLVLNNVNLRVEHGEFIVIRGKSGVGKTTLTRLLTLLSKPDNGKIYFNSIDVNALSDEERARLRLRYIGYVDQFYRLIPTLTILENVELPLALMGIPRAKRIRIAMELLEELDIGDKAYRYPNELSGGERQRAAIARALVKKPLLFVGDEPFSNLDDYTMLSLVKLLKKYAREHGMAIVVTMTDFTTRLDANKDLILTNGRLVETKRWFKNIEAR